MSTVKGFFTMWEWEELCLYSRTSVNTDFVSTYKFFMNKHGIFMLWHKYLVTLKVFITMEDLHFNKIYCKSFLFG